MIGVHRSPLKDAFNIEKKKIKLTERKNCKQKKRANANRKQIASNKKNDRFNILKYIDKDNQNFRNFMS